MLAESIHPSEILRIAADVRALLAEGRDICNLTVGDFSPSEFPIPRALADALVEAVRGGETNYPASPGMDAMRRAASHFYARRLGLDYPVSKILIAAGARPLIYSLFRVLVDPGDKVVYAVPSWNNNHYCDIVGARQVAVPCGAASNFQPTAELLRPHLRDARLLSLNSPLNPTGTLLGADTLLEICDAVLDENARRGASERPLYVMYDQVYWMLTFGGAEHVNPVSLRPAMAEYTVLVDAISKAFAATGLRVGWAAGPQDIISSMADVSSHLGAWAPRPEQMACARFLENDAAIDAYHDEMRAGIRLRLTTLADGIRTLQADGFPVDCTDPQGAIYLSARFALHGRKTPDGTVLRTNEDVRHYLLHAAGLAVVPFQAFGLRAEDGWFRLSVGAVSVKTIETLLPRLREAVVELSEG
jgi:aspartate aminotransferase